MLATFCHDVYIFLNATLHLWMRRMTYNICVQCPVCSKGGVRASVCGIHHNASCKQDQCLHYITKHELVKDTEPLICDKLGDTMNISREQFTPWVQALDNESGIILNLTIFIVPLMSSDVLLGSFFFLLSWCMH